MTILTPRQSLALDLRAQGLAYRAIGDQLGVSHQAAREMVTRAIRRVERAAGRGITPPRKPKPRSCECGACRKCRRRESQARWRAKARGADLHQAPAE